MGGVLRLRLDFLFLFFTVCSASLNDEGKLLLRFKSEVELDPYGVLENWVDDGGGEDLDPCSWFGVGCSEERRVVALNLKDLALRGTLSSSVGDLSHLKSLILHNNSFYGNCPREISKMKKLVVLDLGLNNLSGSFPSEIYNISSLELIVLGGNSLLEISPRLREIDARSEQHVRKASEVLNAEPERMDILNFAIRRVLKVVGQSIGTHPKSGNNNHSRTLPPKSPLSPSPEPLGPQRSHFDHPKTPVSPSAHAPIISKFPNSHSTFEYNPSAIAPSSRTDINEKRKRSWIIYASLGGVILAVLSISALYIFCWRANKVKTVRPWATGLSGQLQRAFVTGVPSLKRVEIQTACEDFSNIVGSFPNCTIYKGILSSGAEIAVASTLVSSAREWSKHSETQFRKKIAMFSKVNHKNFANLLGYCEENEPFTRMMVFEYAPNGTLFEHLHMKEAEHLDWPSRVRIAVGVAYCLDHMHNLNPPVVLPNLDSSSIYITDDCAAKVSDLAFSTDKTEIEPSSRNSGPLDSKPAEMADVVYKFGVLLLELISGRLPFAEDDGLLVLWASSYLSGELPQSGMVDPTLESCPWDDLMAFCELIRSCINPEAKDRPMMEEVSCKLRRITAMSPERVIPKHSPLWWAELEIVSAADN